MKPSARLASVFILLFFLSFNALQIYLIKERITEAKNKYGHACSGALISALNDFNKMNTPDTAVKPAHGWIVYAGQLIEQSRVDSHTVQLSVKTEQLYTDTVEPVLLERMISNRVFKNLDMGHFDRLFKSALDSQQVHAPYRIDTFNVPGKRFNRMLMQSIWERRKTNDYPYATPPVRIFNSSNLCLFAEVKADSAFMRNDLLWPMIAFAFILLIGNTALVFVYKTIRRQKRLNELKTDFINNITHEMKTPITIASAGIDALEHQVPSTERTSFYLHTSKRQLHLLNEFVERIVEAAVEDVSDFRLKKEKIELHLLFSELVQSHSLLQTKPVHFKLTGSESASIQGDRLHLETAFINIVDNAIKYSNSSVNIAIDITESSRDCTVTIRDTGMGIPQQYLKNIFEKFFRVPQGDAQKVKGFGLGLYYVSHIVKKHGGSIAVHSKPQTGTEFIITLPK